MKMRVSEFLSNLNSQPWEIEQCSLLYQFTFFCHIFGMQTNGVIEMFNQIAYF